MENKLQKLLRFMQKQLLWQVKFNEDVTVGIPVGFFCFVWFNENNFVVVEGPIRPQQTVNTNRTSQ